MVIESWEPAAVESDGIAGYIFGKPGFVDGEDFHTGPIIERFDDRVINMSGKCYWLGKPAAVPAAVPSAEPTATPSAELTATPSAKPNATPSAEPAEPSADPSAVPSSKPSAEPSAAPSAAPSAVPSAVPTAAPSAAPSAVPSAKQSAEPSAAPSAELSTALSADLMETEDDLPPGAIRKRTIVQVDDVSSEEDDNYASLQKGGQGKRAVGSATVSATPLPLCSIRPQLRG